MSIKTRLSKLEAANIHDDMLNVVLLKPYRDEQLPEPEIRGSVKVSWRYTDKPVN
jgi:hypothetical protein